MKRRDEDTGEIEFAGFLNGLEVSYLLQFAINGLMTLGVTADLEESPENEDGDEVNRFGPAEGSTVQ